MSLRERTRPGLGIIEPCPPSPAKAPPSGPGWLHEIKHDGFRIMARRDSSGVRLITREVVRPRPRSRVSTWTVPAAPSTEAFTLTLLIVPLLLKVLKLAAARITRQLAQ